MAERVVVRVPATVANLGPGFDCLGLALSWHNQIVIERRANGLAMTAEGAGAEGLPLDASNLVVRAIAAVLGDLPSMYVHEAVAIPGGRGFGSSASAIVAGLIAARALADTPHTDDELLGLAVRLEGHPDNVAPCMLGGVTVSAAGRTLRFDPSPDLNVLVCVAPTGVATSVARAALPQEYSREDAVHNLGRAALLTAALAFQRWDALLDATQDRLHQPHRFELMTESGALVGALRARGIAAFLSGAGPSVAALIHEARADEAIAIARSAAGSGWDVRVERIDSLGATVLESI